MPDSICSQQYYDGVVRTMRRTCLPLLTLEQIACVGMVGD